MEDLEAYKQANFNGSLFLNETIQNSTSYTSRGSDISCLDWHNHFARLLSHSDDDLNILSAEM
jgi:hypothetical protein